MKLTPHSCFRFSNFGMIGRINGIKFGWDFQKVAVGRTMYLTRWRAVLTGVFSYKKMYVNRTPVYFRHNSSDWHDIWYI